MAAERCFSLVLTQRANEKNGVFAIDNDSRDQNVLKGHLAMKIQLRMLALICIWWGLRGLSSQALEAAHK
jgi:hypothetical protein